MNLIKYQNSQNIHKPLKKYANSNHRKVLIAHYIYTLKINLCGKCRFNEKLFSNYNRLLIHAMNTYFSGNTIIVFFIIF